MLDRRRKDLPRLVEIVAGEQHAIDLHAVLGPLLDLVVVAVVRLSGSKVSSSDCLIAVGSCSGLQSTLVDFFDPTLG